MLVRTRMATNPFTVSPEHTVPRAREVMETHNVRHLPVVDNGVVVGVISRGDLDKAGPSAATTFSAGEITYLLSKLKVAKVMTRNPITVTPDTLLEQAALLMRDNKIEMLPVLEAGKLVGVITESNILDAFIDILGFRDPGSRLTVEAIDKPGVLSHLTGITAKYGANITHLAVYRTQLDRSIVVLGLNTLNTEEIEKDLAEADYRIVAKLQNQ